MIIPDGVGFVQSAIQSLFSFVMYLFVVEFEHQGFKHTSINDMNQDYLQWTK